MNRVSVGLGVGFVVGVALIAGGAVLPLDSVFNQPSAADTTNSDPIPDVTASATNATWDHRTDPDDPGVTRLNTDYGTLTSQTVEYYIHAEINDVRRERGLPPLRYSSYLSSVARGHGADMGEQQYFAHENLMGEQPWERFGSDWTTHCGGGYGENLARNAIGMKYTGPRGEMHQHYAEQPLAEQLVVQWMESPDHRETLLDPKWTTVGTGVYINSSDGGSALVYAGQNFCKES
jgi:uncharacterized protein YkwD